MLSVADRPECRPPSCFLGNHWYGESPARARYLHNMHVCTWEYYGEYYVVLLTSNGVSVHVVEEVDESHHSHCEVFATVSPNATHICWTSAA